MKATSIFPDEHCVIFRVASCGNNCLGFRRDTCGAECFCIGHATPEVANNLKVGKLYVKAFIRNNPNVGTPGGGLRAGCLIAGWVWRGSNGVCLISFIFLGYSPVTALTSA